MLDLDSYFEVCYKFKVCFISISRYGSAIIIISKVY